VLENHANLAEGKYRALMEAEKSRLLAMIEELRIKNVELVSENQRVREQISSHNSNHSTAVSANEN
jgi:hypothetical protein